MTFVLTFVTMDTSLHWLTSVKNAPCSVSLFTNVSVELLKKLQMLFFWGGAVFLFFCVIGGFKTLDTTSRRWRHVTRLYESRDDSHRAKCCGK